MLQPYVVQIYSYSVDVGNPVQPSVVNYLTDLFGNILTTGYILFQPVAGGSGDFSVTDFGPDFHPVVSLSDFSLADFGNDFANSAGTTIVVDGDNLLAG